MTCRILAQLDPESLTAAAKVCKTFNWAVEAEFSKTERIREILHLSRELIMLCRLGDVLGVRRLLKIDKINVNMTEKAFHEGFCGGRCSPLDCEASEIESHPGHFYKIIREKFAGRPVKMRRSQSYSTETPLFIAEFPGREKIVEELFTRPDLDIYWEGDDTPSLLSGGGLETTKKTLKL